MSEKNAVMTQGPWEFATFNRFDGDPLTSVEDVAQTVAASCRHEGQFVELWGVTIAGTDTVICYTGNGPTSEANARVIGVLPELVAACREAKRVLDIVQDMVIINRDPGTQGCIDQLETVLAKLS